VRYEIGGASKKVQQLAEDDQDSMLLMTIPGVGYYSALLIKSEIGDVKRFPSAKQLCSYAGLVPSTYASGNVCYHGHITKQGSRWLRWILIEAAIHAVKRPGALRRFYFKVERKKGGQSQTTQQVMAGYSHWVKGGQCPTLEHNLNLLKDIAVNNGFLCIFYPNLLHISLLNGGMYPL